MQSDVVIDTAFPEYDVAVAKVIDDVLLDMGYVIFPVLTLFLYPHCLLTDNQRFIVSNRRICHNPSAG